MFIRIIISGLTFLLAFSGLAEDKKQQKNEEIAYEELNKKAVDSFSKGKLDNSWDYFQAILSLQNSQQVLDQTKLAYVYFGLGRILIKKENFAEAIKYFDKALILLKNKDVAPAMKAELYLFSGIAYYRNGQIDKSLEFDTKAFELGKQIYGLEHPRTATYLACLATSYYAQKDYKKAIKLIEQSYLILKKTEKTNKRAVDRVKEKLEEWKKKIPCQ